ncbi:AraC family transcriptional regulator [Algisphaera agarilytica]|uniref:LacI family transcriptional regulator n=1 Tax=Algisphaera agarilytica TaxID=1385975 RepID=A0A7X0H645_9BACT|nr:DNA-binding transcriptional regulator [Algisphaera agarilytica]MBB6429838.1 LacI family transcriptional regulator [Algisphaera agarilytica]
MTSIPSPSVSPFSPVPRVAVLVHTSLGWGRRLMQGVFQYGYRHGRWNLDVRAHYPQGKLQVDEDWDGDGVIAAINTPELAEHVNSLGVPYVNVSAALIPGVEAPRVVSDIHLVAEMATQHFLERGFRHFAYSGREDQPNIKRHREAFEAEVARQGFQTLVDRSEVSNAVEPNRTELMQHLQAWVKSLPKPCAIYLFGTQRGVDLIEACRRAGVVVPHEVAILAGDRDNVLCEACDPAMSSIVTGSHNVGYEAAHALDRLIRNDTSVPMETLLPPVKVHATASTDTFAVTDQNLIAAMRFIDQHALEPIQMEDVAAQVPITRRSLDRNFKEAFGKTPAEVIRWRRVRHAQKLLAETSMDVEDVAKASGLKSYTYLSQVFKRMLDETPGAYRKRTILTD